ncbi:MAG: hypothetical protein JWO87_3219 [Phycisphaerales bacterium]|jgi:hypothetical protein|nr:hypothetical protein [Phycisphaerales bacterium]MDB5301556.1 hypothetical protein [Phycisphaerales bacterium]MDB5302502.1 hypothetical protein [Phycisphaerales bacterium]
MSIVVVKPVADSDAPSPIAVPIPAKLRRARHVLHAFAAVFGWLQRHLPKFRRASSTPWEVRMAEKGRHKEIRRELRGLSPTHDPSTRSAPPVL